MERTISKSYRYVESDKDSICIGNGPSAFPILWNRKGLYRFFPESFIDNKIRELELTLQELGTIKLNWNEGISISIKIVRLLLLE